MIYLDLWMLLNFAVDFLLILGTNALSGFPLCLPKSAVGAALGGLYGGLCLVPEFFFLAGTVWRVVFLGLMSVLAFGKDVRRCILFVLISMALGGLALGMGRGSGKLMLAALSLFLLCWLGFRGKPGQRFTRLLLRYQGRQVALTALRDTGNTLRDPITGDAVLVVGQEIGEQLGLTKAQMSNPIESLEAIPGLRLIPYRAVGCPAGMLLCARMEADEKERTSSILVAFAPQSMGHEGYQGLIGGV